MSHQWPEWKDVEEGSEDSVYSIRQVLSFLRGAYKDRDYNKAEKLLKLREDRIKDQVLEEVKPLMVEMEKKIEVETRLRMEAEKGLELKIEVEEGLRKECEELREEILRFKSREKMKGKVADVEKDEKERVKDLEMKLEIEIQSSKRTEKELEMWMRKFYELEAKVLSLTKDYDSFRSLEADAQGSEMEVEAEVQATVRSSRNQIAEGANSVNPVSAAEHGLGNCIEISSSSDDDPLEVRLGSKDKSDLAQVKLDYESDHGSPEVSSGLKRKHMTSIHEDKTESIQQPSTSEGTLPKLPIQDENVEPSSESLTPAPGFDILKSVNPGQAEGTSRGSKFSLDDEHDKKSLLEKLKPHWDDISSDSSSDL